jgi:hypothetical protein
MQYLCRFLSVLYILGIATVPAWSFDTTGFCDPGTQVGPIIACDDFDDYCQDPPCDDAIGDDSPNQDSFLAVWPSDGCQSDPAGIGGPVPVNALITDDATCGDWTWDPASNSWIYASGTDPCAVSLPFAARQNVGIHYPDAKNDQYLFDGTSHRHDLVPRIQELEPTKGSVNGTDTNPLVLSFVLDLPGDSMHRFEASQTNRYVELTDGSDRAPADITIVVCDPETNPKWRPQVAHDDGLPDELDHHAIAVGVFALLEGGGVCSSEPIPTSYRLSVYNGDRWYELKPMIFGNPDLKVGGYLNYVTLEVRTSTIIVTIDSMWDQPEDGQGTDDVDLVGEPWNASATVPRVYKGGFAALHAGNGACVPSRKRDYIDDLLLRGGVLGPSLPTGACCMEDGSCLSATSAGCTNRFKGTYAGNGSDCASVNCEQPPGACCLPGVNDSCESLTEDACLALNGSFNGVGTVCGEVRCCLDPFADTDLDGDVDQDDFGAFQACITGLGGGIEPGCACYDRDNNGVGDGDIDQDDFGAFELCASGPAIFADPSCDDPL